MLLYHLRKISRQKIGICWPRRSAERIWGDFFFFGPANFRKIGGEFLSEF